jgi:hypothetical protein
MNPLVTLKEKMMIKPRIEESTRVVVVIKGNVEGIQGETKPVIEIKENKGFDRSSLLKKLSENKKLKVTVKPFTTAEKVIERSINPENTKKSKEKD